jgi:hypothetical protein
MRIFIHSPSVPADDTARQAFAILREAHIYGPRAGGTINGRAVILIDTEQVPKVIAALRKAGVQASLE